MSMTTAETVRKGTNVTLAIACENWDSGDPFGSAAAALGAVVDAMGALGMSDRIPSDVAEPGACGWHTEEFMRDVEARMGGFTTALELIDAINEGRISLRSLTRAMRALSLHIDLCRAAGRDY